MSDVSFAVRAASSGIIYRYGRCPSSLVAAQAGALEIAEECPPGITDETHYYDGQGYAERPAFVFQVTSLEVTTGQPIIINNIPAGTKVNYPGGQATVDDGFIEWSCAEPGDYEFRFENFPYRPEVIVAKVTAA